MIQKLLIKDLDALQTCVDTLRDTIDVMHLPAKDDLRQVASELIDVKKGSVLEQLKRQFPDAPEVDLFTAIMEYCRDCIEFIQRKA